MSPDRLPALLRQRELLTQHLAWLDAEIAAAAATKTFASASADPAPVPFAAPVAVAATAPAAPAASPASIASAQEPDPDRLAAANARANEILERYAATESFNPDSTRRGCLLFAIATLVIGVVGLFVIYVLRYR